MSIESRSRQYGVVFDHWRIKEFLGSGSGGKSAVFKLRRADASWGESALKVINLIEERGNEASLTVYRRNEYEQAKMACKKAAEREVQYMDELRGNSNIVDYLDHKFVDWSDESGFGCDMLIRMELLEDLRSRLRNGNQYSQKEILKIGRDICMALVLCHRKGIIHRDIKPENIFINSYGNYKLGDFGVSRILSNAPSAMASTGIGTPEYAAPEQFSGGHDKRVDIYSLGLVLYELSNGNRLPFAETSYVRPLDINRRQMGEPLPAPSNASKAFADVILKACAFKKEDRYQTAEEFLKVLNSISENDAPMPVHRSAVDYTTQRAFAEQFPNRTYPDASNSLRQYETVPAERFDDNGYGNRSELQNNNAKSGSIKNKVIIGLMLALVVIGTLSLWNRNPAPEKEETKKTEAVATTPAATTAHSNAHTHTWREATCTSPKTCTTCGATSGSTANHQWRDATYDAPKTCIVCGATTGSALNPLAKLSVGDRFIFGSYEQDGSFGNGAESIDWIVLDKTGDKILVISQYALDCQRYHRQNTSVDWETSSVRSWLNSTFYNAAFSSGEKNQILMTKDTDTGAQDKVFLLSIDQLERYYSGKKDRICRATGYAIDQNAYVNPSTGGSWWLLRTVGKDSIHVMSVNSDGVIDYDGGKVASDRGTVRPAMWLDTSN